MDDLTTRVLAKSKNKQKGGGTKKHGRNKNTCAYYRLHVYRKNKLRKLEKHLYKHVNDECARSSYERLRKLA
jgi:hypothetical protein